MALISMLRAWGSLMLSMNQVQTRGRSATLRAVAAIVTPASSSQAAPCSSSCAPRLSACIGGTGSTVSVGIACAGGVAGGAVVAGGVVAGVATALPVAFGAATMVCSTWIS